MNKKIGLFLLVCVIVSACLKTDFDMVSNHFMWTPDVSFPLGDVNAAIPQQAADGVPVETIYSDRLFHEMDFNFSEAFAEIDKVTKLMFRINVLNQFPAQIDIEIDFLNSDNHVIVPLTENNPVEVAKGGINAQGKVRFPGKAKKDIYLETADIESMNEVMAIRITTFIRGLKITPEIKAHLSDYQIKTKVGLQAQIEKIYE